MSTSYQVCFADKYSNADPESVNRFYIPRDISNLPQNEWLFMIFTWSINTRVKVGGIICALFTIFTVFYLESFLTT